MKSEVRSRKSEVTGKTYRFSTFQELVDRVPGDRIRDCMDELGVGLGTAKSIAVLTYEVARELSKTDGANILECPDRLFTVPPEFEWVDDGKGNIQTTLIHNGIKLYSLKISRDQPNSDATAGVPPDNR